MATLEEVFNSMSDSDYIHDHVQFIIDKNLRIISIPSEGTVAGVVGDKNVNRINFKMDRYYNGFDMSTFVVRINYINSKDNPNYYVVDDLTIEDDYILFTWLLDSDATYRNGNVNFVVKFLKCDTSGAIKQAFNTTIFSLKVLDGINVDDYVLPEDVYDILSKMEYNMDTYCENKKNEILDSIPEDYQELSNDLDDLRITYKNIFDNKMELGSIKFNTGELSESPTRLRTENFIPCDPNTTYYIHTSGYGVFINYYKEDYSYNGYNLGLDNNGVKDETFITPDETKFIKFRTNDDYGTVYKQNISIIIDDGTTEYVPRYTAYDRYSREENKLISQRLSIAENDLFVLKQDNKLEIEKLFEANGSKEISVPASGLSSTFVNTDSVYHDCDNSEIYIIDLNANATVKNSNMDISVNIMTYKSGGDVVSNMILPCRSSFAIPSSAKGFYVRLYVKAKEEEYTEYVDWNYTVYKVKSYNNDTYNFKPISDINGINNCSPYSQDNVTTWKKCWQFVSYVDSNKHAMIAYRDLILDGDWIKSRVYGGMESEVKPDDHYTVVCSVDELGIIHYSGNVHAQPLKYAKTAFSINCDNWNEGTMTSQNEDSCTYPMFVKRKDDVLLFFYRNADEGTGSGNANWYINEYDISSGTWNRLCKLFEGTTLTPTDSMYLNRVCVDNNGVIHISGTFRVMGSGNINVFYAKSEDGGTTWTKTNGDLLSLPMTRDTVEIVDNVSANQNMLNQNGMTVDEKGNPHIVYFKNDLNGYTNIYHTHYDDGWRVNKVTNFKIPFSISLASYQSEISRPSIISYGGNVYIIYRQSLFGENKGKLMILDVTNYPRLSECSLVDFDLCRYEPSIDSVAETNGILNMLIVSSTKSINEATTGSGMKLYQDWKDQLGGVLTIKMNQIFRLFEKGINVAKFHDVETYLVSPDEKIIVQDKDNAFVKVTVYGKSDDETPIDVNYHGIETDDYATHGTIILPTDKKGIVSTPYVPFDNSIADNDGFIKVSTDKTSIDTIKISIVRL